MTSELNRVETMINELLVLSPLFLTKFTKVDVVAMLQDVIALFEPQAIQKKVEILVKFAVPVLYINCVQVQLKQLFINFLSNGINSMPQGGNMIVKVKVGAGNTTIISFSDSGELIPISKSLMPEESIDSSHKGNDERLDSMLNFKIIENHQGEVTFKRIPGLGKIVEIVLKIE